MNSCTHIACKKIFNSHLIIKHLQNLNKNNNVYEKSLQFTIGEQFSMYLIMNYFNFSNKINSNGALMPYSIGHLKYVTSKTQDVKYIVIDVSKTM